jgi:F-type H+-transporting ATPase subunit a
MGSLFLHIPSLIGEEIIPVSFTGLFSYVLLTIGVIALFFALVQKGLTPRVFSGAYAHCGEQLYLFIENMCIGTIGKHGRKYIPMIMTLWLLIFTGNFISLFAPTAPTAVLSFNLGLALTAVGYVQYEGVRTNGFMNHIRHFAGPKLSGPLVLISVLLFVVEIISEVMKNVSLSLRLYGNIHGGHEAVREMTLLTERFLVPVGAFLLPVKLLTVVVQAMIFTLLTCVYISLVTNHESDEAHA